MRTTEDKTLVIELPVIFTRDTMYWLVKTIFRQLSPRPTNIALDFTKLKKIQVGGITTLSNVIEFMRSAGITTEFKNAEKCEAMHFLNASGLLAQYHTADVDPHAWKTFLPLQLVEYDRSFNHVNNQIIPWLARILGYEERALTSLKAGLGEVFNNIKDHSTINVGCSASHFDAAAEEITICVADFGIGIPGRVRDKMKLAVESRAIIFLVAAWPCFAQRPCSMS